MRRASVLALTVPLLLLGACSPDDGDAAGTPTGTTSAATSDGGATTDAATASESSSTSATPDAATPDDAAATTAPGDAGTSTDDATGAPGDDAAVTSGGPLADVEGGADGQAAADVAKTFFLASIRAEPEACDVLVSFTDPDTPMKDVEGDLELCRTILPAAMMADVEAQDLSEDEQADVLAAMRITGAEVDGDTATVDRDNLSPLFQDALGEEVITLRKLDGQWYVDLDRSFQPAER